MGYGRLLTTREAAELIGLSPRTVEDWRLRAGRGPDFIRLGKKRGVRYYEEAVKRWLDSRPTIKPKFVPRSRKDASPTARARAPSPPSDFPETVLDEWAEAVETENLPWQNAIKTFFPGIEIGGPRATATAGAGVSAAKRSETPETAGAGSVGPPTPDWFGADIVGGKIIRRRRRRK